jgi:protein O-mannosyl-transferase
LRVESVAWATERRDVLSGLFYFSSILVYLRSRSDRASRRSYWAAIALFVCALLSKATSLTLPAVLLVLNVYPLRRVRLPHEWRSENARRIYLEILPFAVLAAATIPLTLLALAPPNQLTVVAKVAVSAYSLMFYLWKTLLPTGLSPLYAMPTRVDPAQARFLLSYVVVVLAAFAALIARRKFPGFSTAALLFLIVILPMLGIVQNGPQIAADRYTYHASPALTILIAGAALPAFASASANVWKSLAAAIVVALMALTWRQVGVWHDPERFWTYVLSTDTTSSVAETALGTLDLKQNRLDEAISHYTRALRYDSTYAEGHDNIGIALSREGKFAEAIPHFERALVLSPRNQESHNNLGIAEANLGHLDEAIAEYQEALEIKPAYADAQVNWGNALVRAGKFGEASEHYAAAVRLEPENADAHQNWGVALARAGRIDDAIDQFRAALAINPGYAEARTYLAKALELQASQASRTQAPPPARP